MVEDYLMLHEYKSKIIQMEKRIAQLEDLLVQQESSFKKQIEDLNPEADKIMS